MPKLRTGAIIAAISLVGFCSSLHAQTVSPADARAIAKEATIYGFPLVDSYRIQYSYFVDRGRSGIQGALEHASSIMRGSTRLTTRRSRRLTRIRPYSYVGADLRAEPLVFTVPAVEKGRYYSLQFIDMYTFNFAYVGSRATGNGAGSYLLAGPKWKGQKPEGIKSVIRSRDRVRLRALSDPALQSGRHREREEDSSRLQGPDAFGVSRHARAAGSACGRFHEASYRANRSARRSSSSTN